MWPTVANRSGKPSPSRSAARTDVPSAAGMAAEPSPTSPVISVNHDVGGAAGVLQIGGGWFGGSTAGALAHPPDAARDRGEPREATPAEAALHAPTDERDRPDELQRLAEVHRDRRMRWVGARRVAPQPFARAEAVDGRAERGEHQHAAHRAGDAPRARAGEERDGAEHRERPREIQDLEARREHAR